MNQIDLIVHAGTKLALWQWLQARGLGTVTQDTDPTSPTFGEWGYEHTDLGSEYLWWRHPQGKMEATTSVENPDPEAPPPVDPEIPPEGLSTTVTYFSGWYATLRFRTVQDMESGIGDWVENSTAISVLEGFTGVGGEGITLVKPEDVNAHLDSIGMPRHEWLGTGLWSDPSLWYLSPVMTGDEREFNGVTYASLIDFNVWTQETAPQLWQEVVPEEPEPPAIPEWAAGVQYWATGNPGGNPVSEVTYLGNTYRCLQSHLSQAGWTPTVVPALWTLVV